MRKFLFLLLFLYSCTKTEKLPTLSQSRILSYVVTNTNDSSIVGAIDETAHTITVYVPFYYGLEVIDPTITLSTGAKLQQEASPVSVLSDTTTYTVTGQDKSTTTYHLKIVIQQETPLQLSGVYSYSPYDGDVFTVAGGLSVKGNFNTLNFNIVKVTLVKPDNQQIALSTDPNQTVMIPEENGYTAGPFTIPNSLDSGTYRVRVSLNGLQTEWSTAIHVGYPTTVIALSSPIVKPGDTFTLNAVPNSMLPDNPQSAVYAAGGNSYTLPIVSSNRQSIVLKVPDDFKPGVYGYGMLTTTYGNGTKANSLLSLTVNAN
jgi:hypothetical protein